MAFIPKSSKPSHTTPKDFRPNSLSSYTLATFLVIEGNLINVKTESIKVALQSLTVEQLTIAWFIRMLESRTLTLKLGTDLSAEE